MRKKSYSTFSGTVKSGSVHGRSTFKLSTCGLRSCFRAYMAYVAWSQDFTLYLLSEKGLLKLGDLSVESNMKSYTHIPRVLGTINYVEMRNWWLLRDVSINQSIVNSLPLQNIFPSLQSIILLSVYLAVRSLDEREVRLFVLWGKEAPHQTWRKKKKLWDCASYQDRLGEGCLILKFCTCYDLLFKIVADWVHHFILGHQFSRRAGLKSVLWKELQARWKPFSWLYKWISLFYLSSLACIFRNCFDLVFFLWFASESD